MEGTVESVLDGRLEDRVGFGVGLEDGAGRVGLDDGAGKVGFSDGVRVVVGFEEGTGADHLEVEIGGVDVFVEFKVGVEIEGWIELIGFVVVGRIVGGVNDGIDVDEFPGSEMVGSTMLDGTIEGRGIVEIGIDRDGRMKLVGSTDGEFMDVEKLPYGVDGVGNVMLVG